MSITRRIALGAIGAGVPLATVAATSATASSKEESPRTYDPVKLEWVMSLIPVCTGSESFGPEKDATAADGGRGRVWPIVGGKFWGKGIKGDVIPGGGDFPVIRPDGVVVIDALYRLRTDDDYQIIIHNKGLYYPEEEIYRLSPSFNVSGKKYAWLRESIFVANLVVPVPEEMKISMGENENDRLIEVFRVC